MQKSNFPVGIEKPQIKVWGDLWEDNNHRSEAGRVYNPIGLAPMLGSSNFQKIKYILVIEIGDEEK